MNLLEFLNYRNNCLSCNAQLTLSFHSEKKQKHIYYNNRLIIQFNLNSITRGEKDYKIGYNIDLTTNDFCIEFYDQSGLELFEDKIPFYLLERYKSLDVNHSPYKIYKHCKACNKYNYSSNHINLNYDTCNLGELLINVEAGTFYKPTEDGYKAYHLINRYYENESWLESFKIKGSYVGHSNTDSSLIKTELINFGNSSNDMINKLSTLLTFS
jgi:hypothetical protein